VPGVVTTALEFRSADMAQLREMKRVLLDLAHDKAACFGLELVVTPLEATVPTPMSAAVHAVIQDAADELGLSYRAMHSGAGHDAQNFADLCPTGMIFVPSVDGVSHSPREFSRWQDCVNGANVLLRAVLKMAKGA
jgi:N-carbamoyl-L-amino-acid hydrolase